MITRKSLDELESLLQTKKEFYLKEKEISFLGKSGVKRLQKIKLFLEFNLVDLEYNELMKEYDYTAILNKLMESFNVRLLRWKVREQAYLEKYNKEKLVFKMQDNENILIICDKRNPIINCKVIEPPVLKVSNPNVRSLVKLLQTYEFVK